MTWDVSAYLSSKISRQKFSGYGVIAQLQVAEFLKRDGFQVALEARVPNRGDGRGGRIDVLAAHDEVLLGIEIDSWRTPKSKSVIKLATFEPLTDRAILLNYDERMFGHAVHYPQRVRHLSSAIDFAAHLNVEFCTDSEKTSLLANAYAARCAFPRNVIVSPSLSIFDTTGYRT